MEVVRRIDGCETTGTPWNKIATLYPSKTGTPAVTLVHSGGHNYDHDATPLMVKFFKEHPAETK